MNEEVKKKMSLAKLGRATLNNQNIRK